jgi:hypothetical protein
MEAPSTSGRSIPPEAQARLGARRRRRSSIRRGIVASGLAAFAIAWGTIAATGSMGQAAGAAKSTATASSTPSTSTSSDSATSSYDSSGYDDAGDDSGSASGQAAVSPVTTQTS